MFSAYCTTGFPSHYCRRQQRRYSRHPRRRPRPLSRLSGRAFQRSALPRARFKAEDSLVSIPRGGIVALHGAAFSFTPDRRQRSLITVSRRRRQHSRSRSRLKERSIEGAASVSTMDPAIREELVALHVHQKG